jgi:predicted kinase
MSDKQIPKGELIIMRGCSGSGKSTRAKELAKEEPDSIVCSADDFFMQDGKYNFDVKLLGKAHSACLNKAVQAMRLGIKRVIIDNTNTRKWEYEKYIGVAKHLMYEVRTEVVGQLDDASLKVYANRNKHGVSLDIIRKQAERFEQ